MAHIEKYKAEAVGHMLAHYRRDQSSLGRENIDPEKTRENVTLRAAPTDGSLRVEQWPKWRGLPSWYDVRTRIEACDARAARDGGRRTRKDAVVLADVVVTLPEDVRPGDEGAFFEVTFEFLAASFGADNVLGGFVHVDEVRKDGSPVRPHMHVPFTPVLDGRFNFKKMVPRSYYQGMHKALGDYLERRMGYRPSVELDEEARAQRLYADKSTDIDRVRGAVEAAVVAPARAQAAQVAQDARKAQEEAQRALEAARAELEAVRDETRAEAERLECLRRGADAAAGDVEVARGLVGLAGQLKAAGPLRRRDVLRELADRCRELEALLRGAVGWLGEGVRAADDHLGKIRGEVEARWPWASTYLGIGRLAKMTQEEWDGLVHPSPAPRPPDPAPESAPEPRRDYYSEPSWDCCRSESRGRHC